MKTPRLVGVAAALTLALDNACESCHLTCWYPHEVIPPLPDFN